MTVQVRSNNTNLPFILSGPPYSKPNAVLLTDAGRTTPLVYGTLMAKVAASGKYVPFTSETAVDGTAIPAGIYLGDEVTAAALVAGDVVDSTILTGGNCTIDLNLLVIENSKLLTTVITVGTTMLLTVEDFLNHMGIFPEDTIATSGFENA